MMKTGINQTIFYEHNRECFSFSFEKKFFSAIWKAHRVFRDWIYSRSGFFPSLSRSQRELGFQQLN